MRNEKIIKALQSCINHCNHCADACLNEDNVKHMVDCIQMDRICSDVCTTLANTLATDYKNVQGLVDYCAQVCEECMNTCKNHEAQHCKDCAEACRQCLEACKQYAA